MNSWLFQGNPDQFRMDEYLSTNREITWAIRQAKLAPQIAEGDEVFIWRAAGAGKAEAGVVALARVTRGAVMEAEDAASRQYWTAASAPTEPQWRVRLRVQKLCLGAKEVVKRGWIVDDPILRDLNVLRQSHATNYAVSPAQAQRLANLVRNTGRTWDHDECLAALWAYHRTYGREVSKLPGTPVVVVAVAIGRAVSGVYNKVMNFRSIDPRDERQGMGSTNQEDHRVWAEFYNEATGELDGMGLELEFRRLWGGVALTAEPGIAPPSVPSNYQDFGQPPNDDPTELQSFARKVRRGQRLLRERLMQLYGERCAISGWGPPCVLQASHIDGHAACGVNHTDNGILLRSDLHDLFDEGLLRICPDTRTVYVDESLKGTAYWQYHGATIRVRADGTHLAERYLRKRWESAPLPG